MLIIVGSCESQGETKGSVFQLSKVQCGSTWVSESRLPRDEGCGRVGGPCLGDCWLPQQWIA